MIGDDVQFWVDGIPIPQGSKNAYVRGKRAVVVDVNASKLKPWRQTVAKAADLGITFTGPLEVLLYFHMPTPKRPKYALPAVKPDIDKLTRAVFDALTDGGLIEDDSRVVRIVAEKHYSETPGVLVTVRTKEN